jgi:hypothetical protein
MSSDLVHPVHVCPLYIYTIMLRILGQAHYSDNSKLVVLGIGLDYYPRPPATSVEVFLG